MWVEIGLRQRGKLALLLWAACFLVVLPRRGRAEFRRTVTADGFREPMEFGCWGCNSEPGVTLGKIQYGVTATDSQLSEGRPQLVIHCKSFYLASTILILWAIAGSCVLPSTETLPPNLYFDAIGPGTGTSGARWHEG